MILNAYWEPLEFELPQTGKHGAGPWRRWIDTALDSPYDIVDGKKHDWFRPKHILRVSLGRGPCRTLRRLRSLVRITHRRGCLTPVVITVFGLSKKN
jgi:hypothetical protein